MDLGNLQSRWVRRLESAAGFRALHRAGGLQRAFLYVATCCKAWPGRHYALCASCTLGAHTQTMSSGQGGSPSHKVGTRRPRVDNMIPWRGFYDHRHRKCPSAMPACFWNKAPHRAMSAFSMGKAYSPESEPCKLPRTESVRHEPCEE